MKKKNLALIASAILIVSGVSVAYNSNEIISIEQSYAESTGVYEGLKYSVEGSTVSITGYTDEININNLIIPDEIEGLPVTKIINSFSEINFNTIKLGRHVTDVRFEAFSTSCKEFTLSDRLNKNTLAFNSLFKYHNNMPIKIIVPETVTEIPEDLIKNSSHGFSLKGFDVSENNPIYSDIDGVLYNKEQTKLLRFPDGMQVTDFIVPETVTELGDYAFYRFPQNVIDYWDIGKKVTYIGKQAICIRSAIEIKIPDDIEYVADYNYLTGEDVKKIYIPSSVKSLKTDFIKYFHNLKEYDVEKGNKYFSSDKGILYNADKTTLVKCPESTELKTYQVSDKTTKILSNAFEKTSLDSITIPKSVKDINSTAFKDSKLTKIKGYKGTYAQTFAEENGYEFIALTDDNTPPSDTPESKYNFDVNDDGTVNIIDLILLMNYLLSKNE